MFVLVAERVLAREHIIGDKQVSVRCPSPSLLPAADHDDAAPLCKTVQIHGGSPLLSEKILKTFFTSREKSGGGPIESIMMGQDNEIVSITFQFPEGTF